MANTSTLSTCYLAGWLTALLSLLLASTSYAQTTYAQTAHQPEQKSKTVSAALDSSKATSVEAPAEKPSLRVYKYNKGGVVSFSDRAPMKTRYEVVTYTCFACNPKSKVDWYSIKLNSLAYSYPITMAAKEHAVDPALVRAVIHAESAFRETAVSRKGAVGLMQLMPATAKELGVKNSLSPAQNIHGGVKYLARLLKLYQGNTMLATAAYNAGPGAVKRYDGIPPFAETQAYVKRVKILHKRYQEELAAVEVAKLPTQASNL